MVYDEHSEDGEPWPIECVGWSEDVWERGREEFLAQKLVVGIGSYGYDGGHRDRRSRFHSTKWIFICKDSDMRRRLTEHVRKQISKYIVSRIRNTSLVEEMHSGTFPSSETGDYSDVKVVSPYGEISWNRLSRFCDEEMRDLMILMVDVVYTILTEMTNRDEMFLKRFSTAVVEPKWNDPGTNEQLQVWLEHLTGRKTMEECVAESQRLSSSDEREKERARLVREMVDSGVHSTVALKTVRWKLRQIDENRDRLSVEGVEQETSTANR
jgi:hypothetical protein